MSKYTEHTSRRRGTPQSEKAHPSQVKNSAGGYTFVADKWDRLQRFLILGSIGGTYYIGERKLTRENVDVLQQCADADPARTVDTIVNISVEGRAPKQDPCIFALAYLSGHPNEEVRKRALAAVDKVCRIGTHLFQLIADVEEFRGWGSLLRRTVAGWYLNKDPRALAYQVVKYRQRGGESHADTLRRAHPKATDDAMQEVLAYAANKLHNVSDHGDALPEDRARFYTRVRAGARFSDWLKGAPHQQVIAAAEAAKHASEKEVIRLIEEYDLVRECVPTEHLNSKKVWEALLQKMPMTAMIRNLGKMSSIGLVTPLSSALQLVVARLHDQKRIQQARVHPLSVLLAWATYASGRGMRGKLSWQVAPQIVDALEDAFYLAFKNVEPTNKRWFIGLDISGSMASRMSAAPITCAEAAGALAMTTIRAESQYFVGGFATAFVNLSEATRVKNRYYSYYSDRFLRPLGKPTGITAKARLGDVLATMFAYTMGGTDCALPMRYALEHDIPVDVFAVYTDNETWAGRSHPHEALEQYRRKTGIPAKLVVVGMTSNGFSIANPDDAGMLDVVGFDSSVPAVMADFARA